MSILQEFENMKYHFVLNLIKKEEQYDKKRKVITASELHKKCYDRFLSTQEILLPLKKRLGDRVEVTDINFVNSNEDEKNLIYHYADNVRRSSNDGSDADAINSK